MRTRFLGIAVLAFSVAASASAADRIIQNGIDAWATPGDGSTFVDFAKNPIPAGFFCAQSAPFTGRVAFRGEPIVTGNPGDLGAADTVVQRLDDATFNKRGRAVTRLQFRALSLRSVAPIETKCGEFFAVASLEGVQPITRMVIVRENEKGGRFTAPLALNVKIRFEPVGQANGELLEIPMKVRFPADVQVPWASKHVAPMPAGFVLVDTDGDRVADTYLPGTSNFIAGKSSRPERNRSEAGAGVKASGSYICHAGDGHNHCFWLCSGCQIP
jgi:hypothetical protein